MKKFFSAFLLMAAMAFSVSTFLACNDVVGEIEDVKAQTTQNAANIEQLQADLKAAKDEAAAAAAAALQAAKDAQKAGDDAMAYAEAAEAAAKKALEKAIAEASAALQAHINDFNTKYALINETLGQKADKTELTKAIADLKAELQTEISSVRTSVEELDKKIDDEVSKLNTKIDDNKKAFDKEIADLKAADVAINTELTKLNTYIETVKTDLKKEISDSTKALRDAVAKAVEEMNKIKAELVAEDARLAGLINTNAAEIKKNADAIAQNATSIADLRTDVNGLLEDVKDAKELLAAHTEDLKNLKNEISDLKTQFDTLTGRVDALFARVQSIVLVPDYNDGKATIHFATIQGYPIIGPSTLKYRVQAINEEETATITESIATAWKANPQALTYDVIPVKERTRSAEDATLVIENVVADGDFLNVTVRPSAFDGAFYTSKLGRNVDSDFTRTTSYSASLIFTDGANNVTSEYYNLYPEVTEIGMKIVIPGEKEELVDITNVLPGENRQKLAYTDVETKKTLLAGHEVLFSVNGEDYTYAALLEKFGYDMTLRLSAEASYSGYEDDVDTYNLPYGGYPGLTFVYGDFTIVPSKDFTVKLNKPLAKEQVGEVLTVEYTYFINDEVSVKTSSEVEMTYEIVNVTIDPVTVEWSYALADQLRGTNNAGEDVPYIKTYIAEGVTHDCPYNLGTILKAISRENKLEKTVKVNGEELTGDRIRFSNYVDADKAFDIEFLKGSPKFSAEGPTEYEIVYHGIYNNQYDVTATAVVVFEEIPTYEVTSNVVLASVSGTNYFGADDALLKDALLNSAINADLGYENVSAAIQGVYNSLTDAVSTSKTVVKYGAKSTDLTAGNGNVQLNLSAENVDLSKVYLFNNQIVDLLGKNILEDETVFTIEHTVTSWNGVELKYIINATTDLPDFTLATDPMYVENDIVEVRGELTGNPKVYTVDVADLARYFYVYNEGAESLVAPSANAPVLDVTFSLKGQKDATGFSIKDNNYVNPVDYAKKGQLEFGKAVVNWGTYPYTEIVVNAVLNANGYPIASKDITLVTIDPLKILFKDVDVAVSHQAGTNAKPVIAKAYTNFTMTSVVEPTIENLCDVEASNVAGLFTTSKADTTYGLKVELELVDNPYYELNGVKNYWDSDKYVVGYDADGNFDGTIYIGADDAAIKMPLKAKVGVKVTHKIHAASEECVNEGVITITFNPAK